MCITLNWNSLRHRPLFYGDVLGNVLKYAVLHGASPVLVVNPALRCVGSAET
jgi:hypothetical protein